jgi:hypothetical protein
MAGAEDMAERAWLRMGHRSENQAVVFLYVLPQDLFCNRALAMLTMRCLGANQVLESPQFDPTC